jgi:hypothetical protein
MKNKMQGIFVFVLSFFTISLYAQVPEQTTTGLGTPTETKIPEVQKTPTPDRTGGGQTTQQPKDKKPKGRPDWENRNKQPQGEQGKPQTRTEGDESNRKPRGEKTKTERKDDDEDKKGEEHSDRGRHIGQNKDKNKDKVKNKKREDNQNSQEGGYPENRKHNDNDEKKEKKGKGC